VESLHFMGLLLFLPSSVCFPSSFFLGALWFVAPAWHAPTPTPPQYTPAYASLPSLRTTQVESRGAGRGRFLHGWRRPGSKEGRSGGNLPREVVSMPSARAAPRNHLLTPLYTRTAHTDNRPRLPVPLPPALCTWLAGRLPLFFLPPASRLPCQRKRKGQASTAARK